MGCGDAPSHQGRPLVVVPEETCASDRWGGEGRGLRAEAEARGCPGRLPWEQGVDLHLRAPKAHSDLRDHGLQGGLSSSLPLCPCWPRLAWERVSGEGRVGGAGECHSSLVLPEREPVPAILGAWCRAQVQGLTCDPPSLTFHPLSPSRSPMGPGYSYMARFKAHCPPGAQVVSLKPSPGRRISTCLPSWAQPGLHIQEGWHSAVPCAPPGCLSSHNPAVVIHGEGRDLPGPSRHSLVEQLLTAQYMDPAFAGQRGLPWGQAGPSQPPPFHLGAP